MPTAVADWLAPDGPLALALPGFESRPEQERMAAAVAEAFAAPHHLAVEAGTGVGKTFGYLLPALEQVFDADKRIVVSTHTIALQEQLIHKDLPLLRRALGRDFRAELVKGRHNYLGLRRLAEASKRQQQLFADTRTRSALHVIEDWAYKTQDGSLSDLSTAPPPDVWEKVRSEHNNCLGRRCATYETCFYQRARRRAEQANLLVVNHALLIADLVLRRDNASVLPNYDLAIIDEAHTLDQVATGQLGRGVSGPQVQYALANLFNERTGKGLLAELGDEGDRDAVVAAAAAATAFFRELRHWQIGSGRSNGRLVRPDPVANPLSPALRAMNARLEELRPRLPREDDQYELNASLQRSAEAAADVEALLSQSLPEHVYWIEADTDRAPRQAAARGGSARGAALRGGPNASTRVSLHAAPLNPGQMLREMLFERVPSVILTSATLATSGAEPFAY